MASFVAGPPAIRQTRQVQGYRGQSRPGDSAKQSVWFPEGERSPNGKLQDFKPGIGMLLEKFPVCVIPVFIHGTHEALPPGKFLPRLRSIRLVFGKPLDALELKREGRGEKPHQQIVSALQDKVAEVA